MVALKIEYFNRACASFGFSVCNLNVFIAGSRQGLGVFPSQKCDQLLTQIGAYIGRRGSGIRIYRDADLDCLRTRIGDLDINRSQIGPSVPQQPMHKREDCGVNEQRDDDRTRQDDKRHGSRRRKGKRVSQRAQLCLDVYDQVLPHDTK